MRNIQFVKFSKFRSSKSRREIVIINVISNEAIITITVNEKEEDIANYLQVFNSFKSIRGFALFIF